MKRFFIDALLILLLVAIGNGLIRVETDPLNLDEKIARFERKIEHQERLSSQVETPPVVGIELNQASKVAQKSSEMIESVVGVGVEIVASVFKAIVE